MSKARLQFHALCPSAAVYQVKTRFQWSHLAIACVTFWMPSMNGDINESALLFKIQTVFVCKCHTSYRFEDLIIKHLVHIVIPYIWALSIILAQPRRLPCAGCLFWNTSHASFRYTVYQGGKKQADVLKWVYGLEPWATVLASHLNMWTTCLKDPQCTQIISRKIQLCVFWCGPKDHNPLIWRVSLRILAFQCDADSSKIQSNISNKHACLCKCKFCPFWLGSKQHQSFFSSECLEMRCNQM